MLQTTTQTKPAFTAPRLDVHDLVTHLIIEQLEKGVIPWQQPWTGAGSGLPPLPFNFTTNKRYIGVNILMLWGATTEKKFSSNQWAGFGQWNKIGEKVRRGENGTWVVFYEPKEIEVDGEIKKVPLIVKKKVFNREQLSSYDPTAEVEKPVSSLVEKIAVIDQFVSATKAIVEHHDGGACYNRKTDKISMPYIESFVDTPNCTSTEGYYGAELHELAHWAGAPHRLSRTKGKKFGDQEYAFEELVAELSAAFLCSSFGIATVEKGNHASYIDFWLKVLKENKHCIVAAASEASKAFDYLHSFSQPE